MTNQTEKDMWQKFANDYIRAMRHARATGMVNNGSPGPQKTFNRKLLEAMGSLLVKLGERLRTVSQDF